MTLYWPADEHAAEGAPRLHALIVGVGDYEHLGLGVPKPATFLTGLAPLTTTPLSAKLVAKWLEVDYKNADCPLGSIELLLAPAEPLERTDHSTIAIERASMDNLAAAFRRWYERCDSDRRNIAFFYFAGHGLSTVSQFLLLSDFGNPANLDEWENCIDFTGMRLGMSKCAAQTQLYFVDACRDAPIGALTERRPHGRSLVSSSYAAKVDVSAVYAGASEGRQAYGRNGEETFFCKALIMCLNGVAAYRTGGRWLIDAASLSRALSLVMERFRAAENLPLTTDCSMQRPAPLHHPSRGGCVLVTVSCAPSEASSEAAIRLTQAGVLLVSPRGGPRPWMEVAEAGDARIDIEFATFPSTYRDETLLPPVCDVEVQV